MLVSIVPSRRSSASAPRLGDVYDAQGRAGERQQRQWRTLDRMDTGSPTHDAEAGFRPRSQASPARAPGRPATPRARRRRPDPALRRGRRGARHRERRLGLQTIEPTWSSAPGPLPARVRPELPADFATGSAPLAGDRDPRCAAVRLDAADRGLPRRLHFVIDGHHRVSVAAPDLQLRRSTRYHRRDHRDPPRRGDLSLRDLPLNFHQRLFFERVPLSAELRPRIRPSTCFDYAGLAEGVEVLRACA